jgi:prephenate dehydrogenase
MYKKNIVILGGGSKISNLFLKKIDLSKYKIIIFNIDNKKKTLKTNTHKK